MSFNRASFCKASSGPYRLWVYSTEDNLASLTNSGAQTGYFMNANLLFGMQVREGDVILASNSATKVITNLGVTFANAASVLAQANFASQM